METVYIAGGCLWGVQHFFDTVPGVQMTEAGRANGTTSSLDGPYDGYAECVKVVYDEKNTSISELMAHLFEIIDPYSLNKQGVDVGKKYRTGLYSTDPRHLEEARAFINGREDRDKIMLEVLPLTNYVRSAEEHQHHLERHPEDCSYCHIPGCCPEQIQKISKICDPTIAVTPMESIRSRRVLRWCGEFSGGYRHDGGADRPGWPIWWGHH